MPRISKASGGNFKGGFKGAFRGTLSAHKRLSARFASLPAWILPAAFLSLVAIIAASMIWLAVRYESAEEQQTLELEVQQAAAQIKNQLLRDVQTLQAMQNDMTGLGALRFTQIRAKSLLQERTDFLRLQWWSPGRRLLLDELSPHVAANLFKQTRVQEDADTELSRDFKTALGSALSFGKEQFSPAYFVPIDAPNTTGTGIEALDIWVPVFKQGQPLGVLRGTYSFQKLLTERVPSNFSRDHDVAITQLDGTHLARLRHENRQGGEYLAQGLIDVPGAPFQLRATKLVTLARFFPSVLTVIVVVLTATLLATFSFLFRDVQTRLRVQRQLREQFAYRQAMESSLVTGLRARAMDGTITYVNRAFCELVGFNAKELVGVPKPLPYWAPEELEAYEVRHAQVIAGTITSAGFETVFMTKTGQRVPVLVYEARLLDAKGVQTGWMGSILDLSELRRVEALARQQQEQLAAQSRLATMGELSSSLSHELNQPLSAISSYGTALTNMLKSGSTTPAELQDGIARMIAQAQRAGQVIKSVHDFVKRKDPVREIIDVRRVINGMRPMIELQTQRLQSQKGASNSAQIQLSAHVPDVLADRVMLEQVLLNLVRNAVDAMIAAKTAQPHLKIIARAEVSASGKNYARVSVIDNGLGIDETAAEKIYSPFFSTKTEGMGMGLSICRGVVEHAGGRLWHEFALPIAPKGEQGCIFSFEIPAYLDENV